MRHDLGCVMCNCYVQQDGFYTMELLEVVLKGKHSDVADAAYKDLHAGSWQLGIVL